MFELIWKAILGGNPMSWAILGLGAVLALGGAFGAGYLKGNDHVITKVINASNAQIANAKSEAAKAQAEQDAKDYAAAKADYEKRLGEDKARMTSYEATIKNLKILVPHQDVCKISPEAMKRLNDPDLIGKDAQ
ncbi:hypothetical protein GC176_20485 [bacterium]|nr:hypothetical protein [bacterium]